MFRLFESAYREFYSLHKVIYPNRYSKGASQVKSAWFLVVRTRVQLAALPASYSGWPPFDPRLSPVWEIGKRMRIYQHGHRQQCPDLGVGQEGMWVKWGPTRV